MTNTPNFAEVPDSIRSIMKSSIEQAKKAFDTFVASSEKMIHSVDTSSVPAADGLKQLNRDTTRTEPGSRSRDWGVLRTHSEKVHSPRVPIVTQIIELSAARMRSNIT